MKRSIAVLFLTSALIASAQTKTRINIPEQAKSSGKPTQVLAGNLSFLELGENIEIKDGRISCVVPQAPAPAPTKPPKLVRITPSSWDQNTGMFGFSVGTIVSSLLVFKNGLLIEPNAEYTVNDANATVTMLYPFSAKPGDPERDTFQFLSVQ